MAQQIVLRRSSVQGNVPTTSQLAFGELAINTHDGRVFLKKQETASPEEIIELASVGSFNSLLDQKMDVVSGAQASNLPIFDSNGQLIDSGVSTSSFAPASIVPTVNTALQPGDDISLLNNNSGYITGIGQFSIAQLSDVSTTGVQVGQVLQWDGTEFIPATLSGGGGGGEANTASNLGTGAPLFSQKIGIDLQFRSLVGGNNISLSPSSTEVIISSDAEVNQASSLGFGADVFAQKSGEVLQFKSILAGTNISINETSDEITINATDTGEDNTGANLGGGEFVFAQKNGVNLEFKSLTAGTNVSLSSTGTEITINATDTGEANTVTNLGPGEGIYAQKVGADLQLKSLIAGNNIDLTSSGNDITISSDAENNTASNLGAGEGVFAQKNALDLEFKSLIAGAGVTLVSDATGITISSSVTSGETNTASNRGAGEGVFAQKTGADLEFKSLVAGSNVSLASDGDTITINASLIGGVSFPLQGPDGTALEPSYSFANSTNSGLYHNGSNQISIASNGSEIVRVSDVLGLESTSFKILGAQNYISGSGAFNIVQNSSDAIVIENSSMRIDRATIDMDGTVRPQLLQSQGVGTNLLPAYSFEADSNTGMLRPGPDQLAFTLGGTLSLSLTGTTIDAHSTPIINVIDPTNPQDAATKAYVDSVAAGESNTASNRGTGEGVFAQKTGADLEFKSLVGGSNVTITADGDEITINSTSDITYPLQAPNGSLSNPSFSFFNSTNSGMFLDGTGQVSLAHDGSLKLLLTTNGTISEDTFLIQDGSEASPGIAFEGATDTGIRRDSATGLLRLVHAGDDALVLDSTNNIISAENNRIVNLATPTGANDAATKAYVDSVAAGESNTASNLGGGAAVFAQKNGIDLEFKTLQGGSNISLSSTSDEVTINAIIDTYSSILTDSGTAVANGEQQLSLLGGTSVTTSASGDTITIAADLTGLSIDDLNDVDITGIATNDYLQWNGSQFVPVSAGAGESNTASNLGGGEDLFAQKSGIDLQFKSLIGGTGITLSSTANEVTIDGEGEANLGANLIGGEGVFAQKVGEVLQFKSLVGGSNVTLSSDGNNITINAAGAAGEINTASNVGLGEGIFAQKVSEDLQFKSLVAGSDITLSSDGTTVTINSTAAALTGMPDGSQSNPGWAFINDPNTGFYRLNNDNMRMICGGSEIINLTTSLTEIKTVMTTNQGTNTVVGYGFTNDGNTGFYSPGNGQIAVSANGAVTMSWSSAGTSAENNRIINLQDPVAAQDAATKAYVDLVAAGETNTAANLGAGEGTFAQKVGAELQFKSLVAGTDITLSSDGDTITINSSAAAGAVSSVFGRTGAVVAQASDYDAIQIDYSNATSGLSATDVQGAIDEVEAVADTALQPGDNISVLTNNAGYITGVGGSGIGDLNDVDTTGVSTNDYLQWNGSQFVPVSGGVGEANTASNIGGGEGLFATKTAADLEFKSLIAGTNISLASDGSTVTINAAVSGETNTASNLGAGEGTFAQKSGANLEFKSIVGGTNVTLSSDANTITINAANASGETNTASNLGAGTGVFAQKNGTDLEFKSLVAGANVSLANDANTVTINALGEANTAANLGAGEDVFAQKSGTELQFKTLVAGTNITLTSDGNTVTINGAAGSGAVDSVFGRTGAVVAQASDYDAIQIDYSNATSGLTATTVQAAIDEIEAAALQSGDNISLLNNNSGYITGLSGESIGDLSDVNLSGLAAGMVLVWSGSAFVPTFESGEANTASNLGTGEGVFASKSGDDLRFKSIKAGTGVTVTSDANEVTINATGGGSGGGSNREYIRVNYNGFGTISGTTDQSAGITNVTIDSSQWIEFEFDTGTYSTPPIGIIYYGYRNFGTDYKYKMTQPATSSLDNYIDDGGTSGNPVQMLSAMTQSKIKLQCRAGETFASNGEHAYIFFIF